MHLGMIVGSRYMEIHIRDNLLDIMTYMDDYWIGRSWDSLKCICWYLKILLDSGYKELDNLGNKISLAKEAIDHNADALKAIFSKNMRV